MKAKHGDILYGIHVFLRISRSAFITVLHISVWEK